PLHEDRLLEVDREVDDRRDRPATDVALVAESLDDLVDGLEHWRILNGRAALPQGVTATTGPPPTQFGLDSAPRTPESRCDPAWWRFAWERRHGGLRLAFKEARPISSRSVPCS